LTKIKVNYLVTCIGLRLVVWENDGLFAESTSFCRPTRIDSCFFISKCMDRNESDCQAQDQNPGKEIAVEEIHRIITIHGHCVLTTDEVDWLASPAD